MRLTSAEMKKILDFIRTHDFTDTQVLRYAGIEAKVLGDGIERRAWEIVGTPWALKLPWNVQP